MEFFERLNKGLAVFFLALALLAFTAYSAASYFLKERTLPPYPTTSTVELKKGDTDLKERVAPKDFSQVYWSFGTRDFTQRPKARLTAVGLFSITVTSERNDIARVTGLYECTPDRAVDVVEIMYPQAWTLVQTPDEALMSRHSKEPGNQRRTAIRLKEVQKGKFKIPITLTNSSRGAAAIQFPTIKVVDAIKETGFVGLQESPTMGLKPTVTDKLETAAAVPGLPGIKVAYRYASHPYRLVMDLDRKSLAVKPPVDPVKPPVKPPVDPVKPPVKPVDPDEAVAKFEVPFNFKGMIYLTKPCVLLEDKEDGNKLKRCYVGNTINGLTILEIYNTSILVGDKDGNQYELTDATRQKYD
ncbi:MAG TPA: hypothetical protein VM141_07935 [Planctomycetota bacterium]|nr:hypothetical protein [Planctomycetota bacterium]